MNKSYSGTQAIARALAVLQAFGPDPAPLTPAEISQRTRLNRSTIYRLLSALEGAGMVSGEDGRYRLGPALIALGELALRQIDLRALALPALRELARASGETVDLEVLRGTDVQIVEEVAGEHVLAASGYVGQTYPAYRASTGKALLAFLPAERLDDLLRAVQDASLDEAGLRADLVLARARGYATSYDELEPHLHAVGAPIFDHRGQAVAAVSISGPAARLPRAREAELAALVRGAALAISRQLGHHESLA